MSSLAIHGGSLAIAEQLTDSSVKTAEIIGGKLTFVSSYDLPDATTPAQVAWSASGTRLAIAYRAGDVVRIAVHHLGDTPELEWTYDAPAAATSGAPLVAWDLADERLAIGFSDGVALWMPGQTAPAPRLAIAATKLAWGPGHRLAIGDAFGIGVYAVDLQPVAVGISGAGDFAWSPSGRLALVDAGGVRVWSQGVLLPRQSLRFFEFQSEVPLVVTRVGWIDDDHMVIVTDHGFVARYTVAAVP